MRITLVSPLSALFVFAAVAVASQPASGEVISVLSPSFESPLNAGGFHTTVTNWDVIADGSQGNVGENINATYADADSGVMMAFSNVGNTGPLSQTLGEVIRKGTYTLTVQVAAHFDPAGSATAGLYGNTVGNVLASETDASLPLDPTAGNWETLTVSFNAAPSDTGQTLGIFLNHGGAGGQVLFDSVTLNFTPAAPEPSSLALAAFGLVGLGMYRRRRMRS